MRQNKIYLDTSILNFFFEEKDLEKARSTEELFREIREGKYLPFISELVLREVDRASSRKKRTLLALVRTYDLPILEVTEECLILSEKYMERQIFPLKYRDDGLHIAIATVHRMDAVVTWNLQHMVKMKTRREIRAINILEGYQEIEICTPMEVIESE